MSALCPLWVSNGHSGTFDQCLLYLQKRTLIECIAMSALCQKQTFCAAVKNVVIRSPRRRGQTHSAVLPKPSALAVLMLSTGFVFRRSLHREVGWFLAFQDAVDVGGGKPIQRGLINPE